ncbi:hypothetical protein LPJ75_003071, partial [Coemansia sp. RSA 2598]
MTRLDSSQHLNGANYFVWKKLVYGIIEEVGWKKTLSDEWMKNTPIGSERDVLSRNSRRAVRMLLSNMVFEVANEFKGYTYAHELWKALENEFAVVSAMDVKNMVMELTTMNYNGNIAGMARRREEIISHLEDNKVSVRTLVNILFLANLPREFGSVINLGLRGNIGSINAKAIDKDLVNVESFSFNQDNVHQQGNQAMM